MWRETDREAKGYYVRERVAGTMRRVVALPADVTEEGGKASYKNGVLEVRIKKTKSSRKSRFEIEYFLFYSCLPMTFSIRQRKEY